MKYTFEVYSLLKNYVSGVKYSDSQFSEVTLHLQLLWNTGSIPCMYVLVAYLLYA